MPWEDGPALAGMPPGGVALSFTTNRSRSPPQWFSEEDLRDSL